MSIGLLRKYNQTSAPKVWANAYGSLVDMLQAVLVDGYGAYPGLGWTKEFESPDTNTIVFRNSPVTGTGVYLQVSHSNAFGLATNFASWKFFESMTTWNTGISACPTSTTLSAFSIGSTTGTTCLDGIHWMVIGDERGFWLCLRPYLAAYADAIGANIGRYWCVFYVGDYIPMSPDYIWNCFLSGATAPNAGYGYFGTCQAYDTSLANYWCMRDGTSQIGAMNVGIAVGSAYEITVIGKTPDISPLNNQTLLTPVFIHDQNSKLLGTFPGCRNPLRQAGDHGVHNYSQYDEEYASTDRTLHLLMYKSSAESTIFPRIGLISGEGFRDVI